MPNGGSDCCGTCWFNAKNKGEAGYDHVQDPEPDFCLIRNLPIQSSFYTYCVNHPHRNQNKVEVPIGPVFTGDSEGYRQVWVTSPDSEEIRVKLLQLLGEIEEESTSEYPIGIHLENVIIWQMGEWRESRAVNDLQRISAFNPNIADTFGIKRKGVVAAAQKALAEISRQSES